MISFGTGSQYKRKRKRGINWEEEREREDVAFISIFQFRQQHPIRHLSGDTELWAASL